MKGERGKGEDGFWLAVIFGFLCVLFLLLFKDPICLGKHSQGVREADWEEELARMMERRRRRHVRT